MSVLEKSRLLGFLEGQSQEAWIDALDELESAIHPVDRLATRIWFGFWPLGLRVALASSPEAPRLMDLEGNWRLEEQIDSSIGFLYGAHFWPSVKRAVLSERDAEGSSLAETIRRVARCAAEREAVSTDLVLGIAAVGLMTFRQMGDEAFESVKDAPAVGPLLPKDPRSILAGRERKSGGLVDFLKGVNRSWDVRWDERRPNALFRAITGQDLAMAGATDKRDYRSLDYRRHRWADSRRVPGGLVRLLLGGNPERAGAPLADDRLRAGAAVLFRLRRREPRGRPQPSHPSRLSSSVPRGRDADDLELER